MAMTVPEAARLLDVKRPGWAWEVDPDTLDMSDTCNCVLGQLHDGSFRLGLRQLSIGTKERASFDLSKGGEDDSIPDEAWEALKQAWVREVQLRREGS